MTYSDYDLEMMDKGAKAALMTVDEEIKRLISKLADEGLAAEDINSKLIILGKITTLKSLGVWVKANENTL